MSFSLAFAIGFLVRSSRRKVMVPVMDLSRERKLAASGVGVCRNCGRHWGVAKVRLIPYGEITVSNEGNVHGSLGGMFPLCTNCFLILPPDEIIAHCHGLIRMWGALGIIKDIDEINESVARAVRVMKEREYRH